MIERISGGLLAAIANPGAKAVNVAAVAENKSREYSDAQVHAAGVALGRREHAAFGRFVGDHSPQNVASYTTAYLSYLDNQVDDINQYTRYRGTDVTARQLLSEAERLEGKHGPVATEARARLEKASRAFMDTFRIVAPDAAAGVTAGGASTEPASGKVSVSPEAERAARTGLDVARAAVDTVSSYYLRNA